MRIATTTLFFCTVALLALGLVMIFSASTGQAEAKYLYKQPIWCGIGLVVCGAVAASDYRWLKRFTWLSWALLAAAVCLLVLVLVPGVGIKANGATRWLGVGSYRMQPSELAKIALVVALAWYGDRYQRQMPRLVRGLVIPGLLIGLVVGLIFLEPDVGTALLLAAVSTLMLVVAGTRLAFLLPPVCAAVIALGLFLWQDPMRSDRIYSWLHLEETKLEVGMQVYQSVVALGSGGITGVGLGDGRQKLGFVPEHHTDFIFSVIGEELGLVATLLVVLAFIAMLVSGIYVAWHASDTFGMLMASGLTFLIAMQAIINIGVVTGALPNKGLSLPFISSGGSNLVIMLACVGLLINIGRHASEPETVLGRPFEPGGFTSPHLA